MRRRKRSRSPSTQSVSIDEAARGARRAGTCRWTIGLCVVLLGSACPEKGDPRSVDAGDPDTDAAVPDPFAALPAPPSMAPCRPGWTEARDDLGITVCHPFPDEEPPECALDEARIPGHAGCVRLGSPCPSGRFTDELPEADTVLYVDALVEGPGSGSRADPYKHLRTAVASARPGSLVVLAKGTYDAILEVPDGLTLWGSCVAETTLMSSVAHANEAVLSVPGRDVTVGNLRIGGSPRGGIRVEGGSLRLRELTVDGTRIYGALVISGGQLDAERVAVRRIEPRPTDGMFGRGILFQGDATGRISQAFVDDTTDGGIVGALAGVSISLEDVLVQRTHAVESLPQTSGQAVAVQRGALLEARGLVVRHQASLAVSFAGIGTRGTLEDLWLEDAAGTPRGTEGAGIQVRDGAVATATRLVARRMQSIAVLAIQADSSIELSDALISDTEPGAPGNYETGRGLGVQWGARATLRRVLLARNRDLSVTVSRSGSQLRAEDLDIRETAPHPGNSRFGRAMHVQYGGQVTAERVRLANSHEVGLMAVDAESHVTMTDLTVRGTAKAACPEDACHPHGIGIGAYEGAQIEVRRFRVEDSAVCGVQVASGGELDLTTGRVAGQPIGACVQIEDYDLHRLSTGVHYEDNETNLATTSLPVPDAALDREL